MQLKLHLVTLLAILVFSSAYSQSVDVTNCPTIVKRSNGNGQYGLAAGYFPGYGQNNPVAPNVVGTKYDTVNVNPTTKTGDVHFRWTSATSIANLPVITRVWLTASGSTSGTLSNILFGPPPPASVSAQNYDVDYNFYNNNMPSQGFITLEFSDPQTGIPMFKCTFSLGNNNPAPEPTIDCSPTITTQPQSQALCGVTSTTFTVVAAGASSYQWQYSANNGGTWFNVTNGGNYSGATTTILSINNSNTYNGYLYRVVLSAAGCPSTTSNSATLLSNPKPTAVFSGSSLLCGFGSRSLGVTLTGTAPWSFTYTTNGGSPVTKTNITTSPYFFTVSPAVASTYAITTVSDARCTNSSPSGNVSVTVNATPTITPTNANVCNGSSSFNLTYSSTGSPNQYSITTGIRALPGFTPVSNATLTASPLGVTIPTTGITAGVYDFNIVVTNTTSGCVSASTPFTLTVNTPPTLYASTSGNTAVCAVSINTLTASPSNLSNYSWSPTTELYTDAGATISYTGTNLSVVYAKPTAGRTYTVTGRDANLCTGTASVTYTIIAGPTLSVTPSAPTICNGNSTILTASNGTSTYSWTPSTGLSATSGATVIASPTSTTVYTVSSNNSSGCAGTGTVTVTVNSPSISITNSSPTICSGGSSTLTATAGFTTYSWTPSAGLSSTTIANPVATPSATTTYFVTGTNASGCTVTNSATVTVSALPIDYATSNSNYATFCSSAGTKSFTVTVNTTHAVTSMTWGHGATLGGAYTDFTSANASGNGTFTPSNTTTQANVTLAGWTGNYNGDMFLRLTIVDAGCTSYYYIQLFDTKGSGASLPSPVAAKNTVCSGEGTTLTIGNLLTGVTGVQWQSSATLAGTYTNIGGATSITYSTGPLTAATNNFFKAVLSGSGSCGYTTGAIGITIASAISNTISPATTCSDGSTAINLTGSSITGGIYQWQSSTTSSSSGFSDIVGAISQNYTLPATLVGTTTWFQRLASTSDCNSTTSASVAVYPPINNNQISTASATTYCGTAPAITLTGTTPVGGSGSYTYQWRSATSSGGAYSDIGGATSINYTTTSQTQTLYYKRVVISGGCANSTSDYFTVTVNANPTITVTAGSTICYGSSTSLTGSGGVSYAWSPNVAISALSGTTVTVNPTANQTYTVTGTDANGCTNTANSTITVTASLATPTLSPASPAAVTICNPPGSFNLTSLVTGGTGTLWFTAPSTSGTYAVATPTAVTQAGTYYVYSNSGSCYSANYASVTLSISNVSAPSVSATSVSVCSPATVDLTSLQPTAPSGVTLEWHTVSSGPNGGNLVGTPTTAGTGTYYLYGYSSAGTCYGPASSAVTVTVNALPVATVASSPSPVCLPNTVNLNSYNTTGNGTYTYDWYTVSSSPSPATLVALPTAITTSGTYYLYATNTAGCMGNASSALSVTINPNPTANINSPSTVCSPTGISITSSTNAGSPSYSWEVSTDGALSWSGVSNGGIYSGATSGTLALSNSTGVDGNQYRYTVTGGGCSTTSGDAVIGLDMAATISSSPVDTSIIVNGTGRFRVAITGSPTASFQWKESSDNGSSYHDVTDGTFSGVTYYGANSSELDIFNAPITMNGYKYKCLVTNNCTSVTSAAANLIIGTCSVPSVGGILSGAVPVCSGTNSTTLTLSGYTGNIVKWQYSTDYFVSDINDVANTTTTLTATNLTTTTQYQAVVLSPGCSNSNSAYADVNVNPLPSVTSGPAASQLIATGNTVTLSVTAANAASYQWQKNTVDIGGETGTSLSFTPLNQTDGGTYSISMTSAASCSATSSGYVITPSIVLYSKSAGNLNVASTWGVNADGTGSTPVNFTRSEHTFVLDNRSGGANLTNLSIAGTLDVKDGAMTITPGSTLTAGLVIRTGTTGVLLGSPTSNLTISGIGGTGTSNLYFDSANNILKDLVINNGTVNLNTPLDITGGAAPGSATVTNGLFVTNDNLTLKSDSLGTARIGAGPAGGGYLTGNVMVERNLTSYNNRAYRLLGPSVSTPTSIHNNWQEGAASRYHNPNPGYGTHITGPPPDQTNGFDVTQTTQPSMFTLQNNSWVVATNTDVDTLDAKKGYLIFIRGDRTYDLDQPQPIPPTNNTSKSTTLRAKGKVLQGAVSFSNLSTAGNQSLITNPYASPLDWAALWATNSSDFTNAYVYWDPNVGTRGGYVSVLTDGTASIDSVGLPANGSQLGNEHIQGGLAFFVTTKAGVIGNPTLAIQEGHKTIENTRGIWAPTLVKPKFRTSLYYYDIQSTRKLADGALAMYDDSYNAAVDDNDAQQLSNMDEDIAYMRSNQKLSIEQRPTIHSRDTLFLYMTRMTTQGYEWQFTAQAFDPTITAELVDNYTGMHTPIDLNVTTVIPFAVDISVPGSKATNRFYVVFNPQAPLPVTISDIKAYERNSGINVDWSVSQQVNMDKYEVEKSVTGNNFAKTGTVTALATTGAASYSFFDQNPNPGANFYRIKMIDKSGAYSYSKVVKVVISKGAPSITIYPNPIVGKTMILQLTNIDKGSYTITLTNKLGQVVFSKQINHTGGSATQTLELDRNLATGTYQLKMGSFKAVVIKE